MVFGGLRMSYARERYDRRAKAPLRRAVVLVVLFSTLEGSDSFDLVQMKMSLSFQARCWRFIDANLDP